MSRTIADLIQERFGLPTRAGRERPADGALALLLSHRTQRRYKPDAIPEDVLEMALAAALSAPSKSDLQQVGIVLVRDRVKQTTIGGWIPDMPWIALAPLFMVFCGDHRRMRRVSELRARPFPNDTLDMFMNAAVDAGGAGPSSPRRRRSASAAARSAWCATTSKLAAMPSCRPACSRWPASAWAILQPGWTSMRLPTAVTVRTDRYDDADLPAARGLRRPARPGTPRRTSASSSASDTRRPTAGRRTRHASTRCRSATTSARSSGATASA